MSGSRSRTSAGCRRQISFCLFKPVGMRRVAMIELGKIHLEQFGEQRRQFVALDCRCQSL